DELDVPMERVRVIMGDTARTPNEGYTAGSRTVATIWGSARHAAAEARQALLALAAERLGADPADLRVSDGVVSLANDPGRSISYGVLLGGGRFGRPVTGRAPVKTPDAYRYIGTSASRLDLAAKFSGAPAFVHDLRLPGMAHARVVWPPSPGASLRALDDTALREIPTALVVRLGDFVAVVAEREEQAARAAQALRVTWSETPPLPNMETLYATMRQQPTKDETPQRRGSAEDALAGAATVVSATYRQPFQAHAPLGPSCAVARVDDDGGVTVWCTSQGVFSLRGALADLLELPEDRVRVIFMEGAGCYGQNGGDDAAADAALIARAVGGPVRVQWTREDEFAWEPKSPAMLIEARGGLDAQGSLVGWTYDVWTPTHANRPRAALDLVAGQLARGKPAQPRGFFLGGERNAPNDYTIPNTRVTVHWLSGLPLRVSSMRSLGGLANTFANESLMDELALAAGADPLEFRLRALDDPRARDVVQAVARQARWSEPLVPDPAGRAVGRGLAFARYENTEAYVAAIAEVAVDTATGAVRARRVVVAHDCGLIVNPDGVRNQIEGNVIQATSRALKEEVRFDSAHVTSLDWETYPILTFSETPDIEIVLLDRPDQLPVGAGEPATVVTSPAIANAIANATGARLRQIPFTPARVREALARS
ncbi:MAG TPA: molybdopterin cofactor-binding domain-containing protein, partial [Ktedonobacterales bacterium]|nr:molybdopterin cofactor-binding domain-containing protein [Ktedonobacterales bacterium]